ncbi:MAG: 3'-5' exonuclease, partial [candidate division WOR-3 bacterium]
MTCPHGPLAQQTTHDTDGAEAARERVENIHEFVTVVQRFDESDEEDRSLARFLEQVALVSDLDTHEADPNAVLLMTLHASKGLEFDVVFLVGLEEGLFPHIRSLESDRDIEEERRLCYVGITRARHELIVTYAYSRSLFGVSSTNSPSRFIGEMGLAPVPREAHTRWNDRVAMPASQPARAPDRSEARPQPLTGGEALRPGERVHHATFGEGIVVSVKPVGQDLEVAVVFSSAGLKRVLQSIARLRRVRRDG